MASSQMDNDSGSSTVLAPEAVEITGFLRSEAVQSEQAGVFTRTAFHSGDMPVKHEDLETILQRPIRLDPVSYSSASSPGMVILSADLPSKYFDESTNALAKLINFQFLSCDIEIELHVNATPLNTGLLMAVYSPQVVVRNTENLRYWSSFKDRVVLDVSSAQDCRLHCQFAHCLNWCQVAAYGTSEQSRYFDFGQLHIVAITPLAGVNAATPINITPWIRLTNVRLAMPTLPSAILPTVAGRYRSGKLILAQAGPAEAVLKATNVAVNAGSAVTGAMRTFGHIIGSKPPAVGPTNFYRDAGSFTAPHSSSLYPGVNMAMDQANISPCNFPSTSIQEYCELPYIENVTRWAVGDQTDTIIASWLVNPATLQLDDPSLAYDVFQPGPLEMASLLFNYWRGNICYRPQFAKNAFVSGKLAFIFVPGDPVVRSSITPDEANQVFSWVVDIRSPDVPEMVLPFVSPTPWRLAVPEYIYEDVQTLTPAHTGILYCVVVNKLVASDTSLTYVDMVMWKRGLEMKFAHPIQMAYRCDESGNVDINDQNKFSELTFLDTTPPGPSRSRVKGRPKHSVIQAQSGVYASSASSSSPLFEVQPAKAGLDTMGESVTHFSELCKRMCYNHTEDLQVVPSSLPPYKQTTILPYQDSFGFFSMLRHMFAYQHGSMRVMARISAAILETIPSTTNQVGSVAHKMEVRSTWSSDSSLMMHLHQPIISTPVNNVVEVQQPWYVPTHVVPTKAGQTVSNNVWPFTTIGLLCVNEADAVSMDVYFGGGDDFDYYWQVPPPRVFVCVNDSTTRVTPPSMDYFQIGVG